MRQLAQDQMMQQQLYCFERERSNAHKSCMKSFNVVNNFKTIGKSF